MTSSTSTDTSPAIRIVRTRAFSYRVPREVVGRGTKFNYVVHLKAESSDGGIVEGLGEGQPRGAVTGDETGSSWPFLSAVVQRLEGEALGIGQAEDAVRTVRRLMASFVEMADDYSVDSDYVRPFRGTLLGVEEALLDLAARALGIPLSGLLGKCREGGPGLPIASHGEPGESDYADGRHLEPGAHRRIRLACRDADEAAGGFLKVLASVREADDPATPLWLDFTSGMDIETARDFVRSVVVGARQGDLPAAVVMDQPVKRGAGDKLASLQILADELTAGSDLDVRIMADESVWDMESFESLCSQGGVRAIHLRPAQVGGLLASLDIAERAVAHDPGMQIFLSRMIGASRVTTSALSQLALSLPAVHHATVSAVVEEHLPFTQLDGFETEPLIDQELVGAEVVMTPHEPEESEDETDDEESAESTGTSDSGAYEGDDDSSSSYQDLWAGLGALRRLPFRQVAGADAEGLGVSLAPAALVGDIENMVTFPEAPVVMNAGMAPTVYDDVDNLHPLGPNGSKGHLLEREALALGLQTTRFSKGAFSATDGTHPPVAFKWSRNPLSSAVSLALCTHKEATRLQLQRAGIPVPQGRTFAQGDFATARAFAERIGYPVVVKPAMGVRGIGVVAGIQDGDQLDSAFRLMSGSKLGTQDFIVEKHVNGQDYRIVVVGDRVVAAILREPASVMGDGRRTVAELMIDKNVARRRNPHLWARPAKYDEAARYELEKAGLSLDSVPSPGQRVQLANTCSLSQGGDSIDVLDELHPSIQEACVKTVQAIPGLVYCGVDFLLEDHRRPLDEQDAGICELNAHAAIGNCEYPMYGTPRKVAATLMQATIDHYALDAHTERSSSVALKVTVRGKVTGVGYRNWLRRRALQSGVTGWVRNVSRKTVEAVLVGSTDATTALVASTILGPRRSLPTTYTTEHIQDPGVSGFEIVDQAPVETKPAARA
ncbi:enolase C-terminal domain-like protein [Nesterenkonia sp. HG001]|uniref:enolase C-terminal domain-like protein n=1 Tax=Nesterenkonia sp. HG001 TaxID=2983207 RepID=UPI002AC5B9D8|nr:enolase C-terminal domain-like protein [Nesterenkonia sp. HG001]MDZ5077001.1 acylphosphatase [Nesterenkonia sp. HG001]